MTAPLEGIRVLEVASWLAVPSCASLLADLGASVIKVEPPSGDAYRRLFAGLMEWQAKRAGEPSLLDDEKPESAESEPAAEKSPAE